jgi:glycosyltransferase involved in cell wall biosynthesis
VKVLVALTYYRPHTSGLTIYAERLARSLAARGHHVTVLTSQYDRTLPLREEKEGVSIVRVPVAFRVSKGVIMPSFGRIATRMVREHDVLSLHLPQFDASGLALRGRLIGKPSVVTYHCDLLLPPSPLNHLVNRVVVWSDRATGALANAIVAYTEDYAVHSRFLSRYLGKVRVIPPPVEVATPEPGDADAFRAQWNPGGDRVIGMAARLATEKGVEVLLRALPAVRARFPDVRVLFAGQHENVIGEAAYRERLRPLLDREGNRWAFVGVLDPYQMSLFFSSLDVLVVPSLNSTESFGLVQVEAMLRGTPSVASDLPGVRQPVRMTGMGEIFQTGNSGAFAEALVRVLAARETYVRPVQEIQALFSTARTAERYEELFEELLSARGAGSKART